jgi:tetratricopeptide (TPR) repeat protein
MKRDALVIGINRYPFLKDTPRSKSKHLKTPASDAEVIAQLLEADDNFKVQRLPRRKIDGRFQVDPDGCVSLEELSQEIKKLFCADNNRDTALLFFAGHGLQQLNSLGNKKKILLATSKTKVNGDNSILLNDLWDLLEESPVKEQIIWLDSCYSGGLLEFKDSDFPRRTSERRRLIIAASHSSEVAYGSLDGKHGVLSGALIEGLNPENVPQGKWITDRTLTDFVERSLKKYYEETKIPQTPQIRRPDSQIQLIPGKGQFNKEEQQQRHKYVERIIPFDLPPLDLSTFTGRNNELKQLEDLLLKSQGTKFCGIAGLAGVGGIGKSVLACYFATVHKSDFPDGVICLRVDNKDVDTIAREFACRCREEIDSEDERDVATIMQEVFADKRILLIFDNADDESILQLRPGGNRCAVIVTTRNRGLATSLGIPKEAQINLPLLPEADALSLLEKLIDRERVQAEPEAAHQLIELVGYLPIAIKIIGSQLSLDEWRSLARHAKRLTEKQQLEEIQYDSEHLNLFTCFSMSLEYLQPDEIDFFACLSVCAKNGFSFSTAMVVTACNDYATEDHLSKLGRLSLINYSEEEKDRFAFHPLIHQFATEKAIELGLQEETAVRHGEYFIQLINREINPALAKEIAAELDDIMLAAEWLQQQELTLKYQEQDKYDFAVCLQPFFEQYGYWEQAVHLMQGFEKLAESNDNWEKVVKFRIQQAKYLSLQGKLTSAGELLKTERIPEILNKIEEESIRQHSEAKWLNTLGSNILMRQKKFEQALVIFKRAVEIEEQFNNEEGLVIALHCLGGVLRRQGKLKEAEKILKRSYAICEKLQDKRNIAFVQQNLGLVFLEQNRLDEAFIKLQDSYKIFKQLGYQRSLSMVSSHLGQVLQKQGKIDEAIEAIQESAAIEEKSSDKRSLIIKLNILASLYQELKQSEKAIDFYERGIEIAQEIENNEQLAIIKTQLSGFYQQRGEYYKAIKLCEEAIKIAEISKNKQQLIISLNQLGGLYQEQGCFDEALKHCNRALEKAKEIDDDKQQLTVVLTQLCGIYQEQGKLNEAIQCYEDRIKIYEEKNDRKVELPITLNKLSSLYQQQGRNDKAILSLKDSIRKAEEIDEKQQLLIALNQLGGLYQQQGQIEKAVNSFKDAVITAQQMDDKHSLIATLKLLAGLYREQKQMEELVPLLKQIVTIAEEANNKQLLGNILENIFNYTIVLCKAYVFDVSIVREPEQIRDVEMILRRLYELSVKLKNDRQQSIVLKSLGQVIHKKGGGNNFQLALTYFRESIKRSDQKYLANIHAAMAQALLEHGDIEQATDEFRISFEIYEKFEDSWGLTKVTPKLTDALVKLEKREEAIIYCQRALDIAIPSNEQRFVRLYDELANPNPLKEGTVKFITKEKKGKLYGFITPDDGGDDIYLRESLIKSISQLRKGSRVEVEVKQEAQNYYAKSLRILTND